MGKVALASGVAMLIACLASVGFAAQSAVPQTSATTGVAPKALAATGKIVGFDDATKTLTLSTAKGEEKFLLGSSARLQEGPRRSQRPTSQV